MIPVAIVLGVVISAYTKLNAVIFGQHISIPPLLLIFAVLILALAVTLAAIVRLIIRDGVRQRPVYVVTTLR